MNIDMNGEGSRCMQMNYCFQVWSHYRSPHVFLCFCTLDGEKDERESAHYVSKTKEAMRRLEELKAETARKQSEMELRRQQKV